MRFKKISSLFEYTACLLKKYNALRESQENNIYRIIEIKQKPADRYKLIIQIIGKSSVLECLPEEIVGVDRLLEGFSKKDIRTITYLACNQTKNPKYRIITQDFCEKFNRMMFKLKENQNEIWMTKTASEIVLDKNLINNLSQEDMNSVSYMAGYECLLEKNIEKKLK